MKITVPGVFAFAAGHHVQPGSFADRHIWLSLLIIAVGMSLPLIAVLIFVQILKWKGIITSSGQPQENLDDAAKSNKPPPKESVNESD